MDLEIFSKHRMRLYSDQRITRHTTISLLTYIRFPFQVDSGPRMSPKLLTKTFGRIESLRVRPIRDRKRVKKAIGEKTESAL